MPTQRFLHLLPQKQERILQAAVQELSRVPVEEASINKIVQAAGIPRGSFYQYFNDKADLLQHLMRGYACAVHKKILTGLSETNGDIFKVAENLFDYIVEKGNTAQNSAFCKNVFTNFKIGRQDPADILQIDIQEWRNQLMEHIRQNSYLLGRTQNIIDLLEAIALLLRLAVAKVFSQKATVQKARETYVNQLRMLKEGITAGGEVGA